MSKQQKKMKKSPFERQAEEAALQYQVKLLGLGSVSQYKDWCNRNGFSVRLDKTAQQYSKEVEFVRRTPAIHVQTLKLKKEKNVKKLLRDYVAGVYPMPDLPESCAGFGMLVAQGAKNKAALLNLINQADLFEKITADRKLVQFISPLFEHQDKWIRDLSTWKASSYNVSRQFSSILRHLFAIYDVPKFMDKAFYLPNTFPYHKDWFIHMGQGHNIRTANNLPIPLTKKMAHYFCQAPDTYSIVEAIRYGQVLGLGGDRRLTDALRETRICRSFDHEDFWVSVIRWLIAQPMLDTAQINPIVDYIYNQRYEPRMVVRDGVLVNDGPAQPGLSMNKRDPETLLRQVDVWHTQLGREKKNGGDYVWAKSKLPELDHWEGKEGTENRRRWTIKELTSTHELREEGRKLRHCVGSYGHSCKSGRTSIWSMELFSNKGLEKVLTIEVLNAEKRINQARGKFNAKATTQQLNILARWRTKTGLSIGSWL